MVETPREDAADKGFWEGGASGHGTNKESSGRPSGSPGKRSPSRTGYRTDIEFPPDTEESPNE